MTRIRFAGPALLTKLRRELRRAGVRNPELHGAQPRGAHAFPVARHRAETINDKDGIVTGVNGTSNHLREATATINFQATPSLKLSTEVRQDRSDLAIYAKSGGPSKSQTSLELQAVYAF